MAPWCYYGSMTENERVIAYLDPESARRLRVMAAERKVRVTVLLREAVKEYLLKESK